MVRCFIGLLIPEDLKKGIQELVLELKKLPMRCKFVENENLHLCFSFLGEVDETKLKSITQKIEEISKNTRKFDVELRGVKMIPDEKYIRVLAIDVLDKNNTLKNLIETIGGTIGGSYKPPHLTICRVKNIENKQAVVEKIKNIKTFFGTLTIDRIQILKSELTRSGPVYTVLSEFAFIS